MSPLLEVTDLRVQFLTPHGVIEAVNGLSFDVNDGERVALVGESGCGKSVTALSIIRLIPDPPGRIVGGQVLFEGTDLLRLDESAIRKIRGRRMAMVFQEPMTSLNPVLTIGLQLTETMEFHLEMNKSEARERAVELLRLVDIPDPERRLSQYSHELSGGMRQSVMIAMAISCNPRLILADEPTTALDVTTQARPSSPSCWLSRWGPWPLSSAERAPWMAVFPGLAISLSVIAFSLFGDGLRDALDPKLRIS